VKIKPAPAKNGANVHGSQPQMIVTVAAVERAAAQLNSQLVFQVLLLEMSYVTVNFTFITKRRV
jgi:hypothetical protein